MRPETAALKGKTDAGIEDYIMQVYHFSQSNPYPNQWLADCRRELADEQSGPWMEFLLQDLKRQAAELRVQMEDACDTCRNDEFLCAYEPAFSEDVFLLKRLSEAEDFPAFFQVFSPTHSSNLSSRLRPCFPAAGFFFQFSFFTFLSCFTVFKPLVFFFKIFII